jgi:hypothetical protein
MEFPGLLTNPPAVFADLHSPAVVPLIGRHKFDAAVAMPAFVPVHKICKAQEDGVLDAQLLGNLSHALPCWRNHPPFFISFDRLAVTTHCSAPSSSLVGGTGRVGEASFSLADEAVLLIIY